MNDGRVRRRRDQVGRRGDLFAHVRNGITTGRDDLAEATDRVTGTLDELALENRDATGDGLDCLEQRVQDGLFQAPTVKVAVFLENWFDVNWNLFRVRSSL